MSQIPHESTIWKRSQEIIPSFSLFASYLEPPARTKKRIIMADLLLSTGIWGWGTLKNYTAPFLKSESTPALPLMPHRGPSASESEADLIPLTPAAGLWPPSLLTGSWCPPAHQTLIATLRVTSWPPLRPNSLSSLLLFHPGNSLPSLAQFPPENILLGVSEMFFLCLQLIYGLSQAKHDWPSGPQLLHQAE